VTWAAGFGPPKTVYHVAGYVIMVWDTNLLSKLGTPSS
jgi:hypothetical protein